MKNASSPACVERFMKTSHSGSVVVHVRRAILIGWKPCWLEHLGMLVPSALPSVRQTNVSLVFSKLNLKEQACVVFLRRPITAGALMARKNERIR